VRISEIETLGCKRGQTATTYCSGDMHVNVTEKRYGASPS